MADIKNARSLGAAVRNVLVADDRLGGESSAYPAWSFYRESTVIKGGSETSLIAVPPKGTKRATLARIVAAIGTGHVEAVRRPGVGARRRLAIVVDVAAPGEAVG